MNAISPYIRQGALEKRLEKKRRRQMLLHGMKGGKGSGGGGSSEVSSDTLRSIAYAKIIDLICEGEIEGLVDGDKSIFLDETPLQAEDGKYNFPNVTTWFRAGTQAQSYIPSFDGTEAETAVGVEVLTDVPIVRTIDNPDLSAVRVTWGSPQIYSIDSSGDVRGTHVAYAIDLQENGGPYVEKINEHLIGKASNRYQRSYRLDLTSGTGPWNIRMRRLTGYDGAKLFNKFYFDSYTEIVDGKFRYPNSALIGLKVDARAFQRIPVRSYHMKLLKVRVPTNYDPVNRTYSGVWDGTYKVAWTNNPVWCWFDLATNTRYGVGGRIDETTIDKWQLYTLAQYCDEMVSDGFGGIEPRFTCNCYIQNRTDAYRLMSDMAGIFRAMVFWMSGGIQLSQDAPQEVSYRFTNANVSEEGFSYSGTSAKARHTVAMVSWNDMKDFCRPKVEYVADKEGITKFGVVETELYAFGCTSRGQAHRLGKWLLYSERMETEIVGFKTGLEGMIPRIGEVIEIADNNRAGAKIGGRVVSVSGNTITLDREVNLISGAANKLFVLKTDGTFHSTDLSETGPRTTLQMTTPVDPNDLVANAVWFLQSSNLALKKYRILGVSEQDQGLYAISALAYNDEKFEFVENDVQFDEAPTSSLGLTPAAPTNLALEEFLYEFQNSVKVGATLSWSAVPTATTYEVSYITDADNMVTLPLVSVNTADLRDLVEGDYRIYVSAINALGKRSPLAVLNTTIIGKTTDPADVDDFGLSTDGGMALLTWAQHPDLDVRVDGSILVRYSPSVDPGIGWNDGVPIGSFPGNATSGVVPLMVGTYMAKAMDSTANFSVNEVKIITEVPSAINFNRIATLTEDPDFPGTKTNMVVSTGFLKLIGTTLFDAVDDVDSLVSWDAEGGIVASGEYEFSTYVDTLDVYTSRITMNLSMFTVNEGSTVDNRVGDVDDWESWDAGEANSVIVTPYISATNDDPSGSPVWGPWVPFIAGNYTGRAFRAKVVVQTLDPDQNVYISDLSLTVDMPERTAGERNVAVGTGGYSVVFAPAFKATPAIVITAEGMATGDYFEITSKAATGFTILFKNSSGVAVARTMDWVATGHGALVA
jgi:hypothetical protein